MAANGFQIPQDFAAGSTVCDPESITGKASTQYKPGDLLVVSGGIAARNTATGKPTHLFGSLVTPASQIRPGTLNLTDATTKYEVNAIPVNGRSRLKSSLTGTSAPTVNGTACNANASTTSVLFAYGGGATDLDLGTVYIPELDQQRNIVSGAVGAGVMTLTVDEPFSRAPTTGDTVKAVPWSKGSHSAVKFDATDPSQGIDTAVANKTGGQARIEGVDLKALTVTISLPYLS
jgi:hypothetical protein